MNLFILDWIKYTVIGYHIKENEQNGLNPFVLLLSIYLHFYKDDMPRVFIRY